MDAVPRASRSFPTPFPAHCFASTPTLEEAPTIAVPSFPFDSSDADPPRQGRAIRVAGALGALQAAEAVHVDVRPDQMRRSGGRSRALEASTTTLLAERARRGALDSELAGELRAAVGIEVDDAETLLLGDLHPRDEALHRPRDAAWPLPTKTRVASACRLRGRDCRWCVGCIHFIVLGSALTAGLETNRPGLRPGGEGNLLVRSRESREETCRQPP